jgi:murein L,D-transpeptidase YcbB/YkuD
VPALRREPAKNAQPPAGAQGRRRSGAAILTLAAVLSTASYAEADRSDAIQRKNEQLGSQAQSASQAERAEARKAEVALLDSLTTKSVLVSFENQQALVGAIAKYQRIAANGGWVKVPKVGTLRPGDQHEAVAYLRARLEATDRLPRASGNTWVFDDQVAEAVRRFQRRHGLAPTGIVDRRTLAALNVPAAARLQQLRINVQRMRDTLKEGVADRYVLVNVPSFELQAVDAGRVVIASRVIVGRQEAPTPSVRAKIKGLNFFPFWNVPDTIAFRDLVPKLYKEPGYLERERIRLFTTWNGTELDPNAVDFNAPEARAYKFRQDPGPQNALGLVRIDMPNEDIVYMHDTPMKKLFDQAVRPFSAGCVRVQKVFELVTWLASFNGDWDRARVDSVLLSNVPMDVPLNQEIDVYFTYLTAWALPNGEIFFRDDLYGRDGDENARDREDHGPAPDDVFRLAP